MSEELKDFATTPEQEAFIKITELIGDLSWGVGLEEPVIFEFMNTDGNLRQYAAKPESMQPIFDQIYKKLRSAPDYQPIDQLRQALDREMRERKYLKLQIEILKDELKKIRPITY